jgi:hypothetical protein
MTFKEWLAKVDAILFASIGLGHRDLRDRLWRDAFEDELSPAEAVEDLVGDVSDPEAVMREELFG